METTDTLSSRAYTKSGENSVVGPVHQYSLHESFARLEIEDNGRSDMEPQLPVDSIARNERKRICALDLAAARGNRYYPYNEANVRLDAQRLIRESQDRGVDIRSFVDQGIEEMRVMKAAAKGRFAISSSTRWYFVLEEVLLVVEKQVVLYEQ